MLPSNSTTPAVSRRLSIWLALTLSIIASSSLASAQYLIDTGAGSNTTIGGAGLFSQGSTTCQPLPACTAAFQLLGGQFTLASGSTITSVEGWMAAGTGGNVTMNLRADASGLPGNSLFAKSFSVAGQPLGWVVFGGFSTALPAGTYWLTFEPNAPGEFTRTMPKGAVTPLANYAFFSNDNNKWVNLGAGFPLGMRVAGTVTPPASATVSPQSLEFTGVEKGEVSAPQLISIRVPDGQAATPFTVTRLAPVETWLVPGNGGIAPGLVPVFIDPENLTPGVYSSKLRVDFQGVNQLAPVDISVKLTVTKAAPKLDSAPQRLRFGGRVNESLTQQQDILLLNTGGGSDVPYQATIVNKSSWITSVTPASGQLAANHFAQLTVSVNTQTLTAGTYTDKIRVVTGIGSVEIPVVAVVAAQGPLLGVGLTGVRFEARQNQGSSVTKTIPILNNGSSATSVSWTAKVLRNPSLLTLTPANGVSTPTAGSNLGIALSNTATATVGGRYALVEVSDPLALNSPQYVVVVADVAAADSAAVPLLSPGGATFSARKGATPPANQNLTLSVSSTLPVNYAAAIGNDDNLGWLQVTPASGTVSTSSPVTLQLSPATQNLPVGVFKEHVNVAIGSEVRGVDVTLAILPAISPAPVRGATGCTPKQVVLTETASVDGFSVPAGWPAALAVKMTDDCGDPINNGSIVASFTNGDPPLSLDSDRVTGTYSASWQPGVAQSPMTVKLYGTSGALTAALVTMTGRINVNATPAPSLVPLGIIHNLNPVLGAPLAPATVVQVYGDNMAAAPLSAPAVPLPNILGNAELIVAGLDAPLYYVSKTQLTAELPSELAPNRSHMVILAAGDAFSLPMPVDLIPVQPGTVQFSDGKLVAQHGDYSLVTAASPSHPNEVLTIYLVGMGATTPAVASGAIAPSDPLAYTTVKPVVTVDGNPAELFFWGLTPGGVGLYQINFRVPPGTATGDREVVITQSGLKANVTKLVVAP